MCDVMLCYLNIFFDFDGIFIDLCEGIICLVQFVFVCLGIDELDLVCLEYFIGFLLLQCFMQIYGFDEVCVWEVVNYYCECFRVIGFYENCVFDGIFELFEVLVGCGYMFYVVISKFGVFVCEIVCYFVFDCYFKVIYGSELDGMCMYKDELICYLFDSEGLVVEYCLMIGDCMYDLFGVSCNGVVCIGVGYGFGSEDELCVYQLIYYCVDFVVLWQVLEFY